MKNNALLRIERLDDRIVPTITYDPTTQVVDMVGTAGDDSFYAFTDSNNPGFNRYVQITNNVFVSDFDVAWGQVKVIRGDLGDGNDLFSQSTEDGERCAIHGGGGNDYLSGGQGGGWLEGGPGDDTINAVDHADWGRVQDTTLRLEGGTGFNTISCGYGIDAVVYNPNDTVYNFSSTPDVYGFTDYYIYVN